MQHHQQTVSELSYLQNYLYIYKHAYVHTVLACPIVYQNDHSYIYVYIAILNIHMQVTTGNHRLNGAIS